MTHEEAKTVKAGDVVYSQSTGRACTVKRISPSGQFAFGEPPYNSGSYVTPWNYATDRKAAVAEALESAKRVAPVLKRRAEEAQQVVEENAAVIAHLEALSSECEHNDVVIA